MLSGIIRESISKADTKSLRKNGYLIANIYGKGRKIFIVLLNAMISLEKLKIKLT